MVRIISIALLVVSIPSFAQTTQWTHEFEAPATAPTLYPNADAPTHIAIGSGSSVILIDEDVKAAWSTDIGNGVNVPPTVANLDGDGEAEIVVGTSSGAVVILNSDGTIRSRYEFDAAFGGGYEFIAAADVLDRDGLELIFGHEDGWMTCMNHDGAILWRYYGDKFRTGPPAVGDVDGDGAPEIIYGTDNGHIYCLSAQGFAEWRYDEFAPYGRSAPLIADADGDGHAEIYITQSNQNNTVCLMALDGKTGAELWRTEDYQQSYVSIAVADLENDGKLEIFHTDKGNFVYCDNADGTRRWATDTLTRGIFFAPTIADVDGDGSLEIIAGARGTDDDDNTNFYVYGADGSFEHRMRIGNEANSATAAADLNGDGVVEIYAVTTGPNAIHCLTFVDAAGKIAWPSSRGDSAMAGSRVANGAPADADDHPDLKPVGARRVKLLLGGDTIGIMSQQPPPNRDFIETAMTNGGAREIRVTEWNHDETTDVEVHLRSTKRQRLIHRFFDRGEDNVSRPVGTLHQTAIARDATDHDDWNFNAYMNNALEAADTRHEVRALLGSRLAVLDTMSRQLKVIERENPKALVHAAREYREYVSDTGLIAKVSAALWEVDDFGSFHVATDDNPWDDSVHDFGAPQISVTALGNEAESVALSITNVRANAIDVRAQWSAPAMGLSRPAADPPLAENITLRRAIEVPDGLGGMVLDALPALDNSSSITIAPGETRQLWLTISTKGLEPGEHKATLYLGSLEQNPTIREVPIRVEVLPVALPDGGVPRMNWSQVDGASDQELQDMIDHGISVVYAPGPPAVTLDKRGNVIKEGDWSRFDAALDRLPDYFQVYVHGPPRLVWPEGVTAAEGSDLYEKAFQNSVRAFVAHMKSIGWGYDRWAFYPLDEPWLTGEKHLRKFRYFCEQVKAADPNARNYTDPTGGMKAEYMEGWEDLIDIWQCEVNWLKRDPELRAWFAENAQEFLAYEATDPGKNLLPLGYYRHYGWLGAALGLDGYGWWVYNYSDLWWPKGGWSMVYPNGDKVVPSRRWEAARDGLEDFKMLKLLRETAANADPHAAATLIALHDEAVEALGAYQIGVIDEITRQVRDYEMDWDRLQMYRSRIMQALVENRSE